MKINSFEELTAFVSTEYGKMIDSYGIQQPSEHFLKYIEDTLKKYTELYDYPLYKLQKRMVKNMYYIEKRALKVEKALLTMPHGRIWQYFHKDLWRQMKYKDQSIDKHEEDKKVPTNKVDKSVTAVVVKKVSTPVVNE